MARSISAVENTDLRKWWAKTYEVEVFVFGIVTVGVSWCNFADNGTCMLKLGENVADGT